MHPQRIILICLALLGISSIFIPWYTIEILIVKTSVNGIDGNGALFLVLFLIIILLTLIPDRRTSLKGISFWLVVCVSLCTFLLGTYELMTLANESKTILGQVIASVTKPGIGLYLLITCSFCITLAPIISNLIIKKNRDI